MKAVILAGGEGTRLRPLTLGLPKPVVPVVDRPFLRHQLDLLARAGVSEIVFSVAYQPERIQAVFGDGRSLGRRIHYAVEETPLGTGGAVKNAERYLDDVTIVFNGDVLTDVDLPAVVQSHRESGARATLVLTPVPNPAAYGLVETDAQGRVKSFIEKPTDPGQITTDTINAGIYVLDTGTLSLMPAGENHSIERAFFPSLLRRGDPVQAWIHRGYWIDIGTPAKYLQVHRDVLHRRFPVALDGDDRHGGWVHRDAMVDPGAELEGPFYVGPGCRVAPGAHVGPDAVLTARVTMAAGARVTDSVVWEGCALAESSSVTGALLAAGVRVGRHARLAPGAVLGEGTVVSEHSRTS
ncbi:MAG TPA: NDP-sugar synthase [Vicinamibacteria bacterium]|nr:NDP-sugar synthase [Vicinamibacteria bacterium]